MDAIKTPVVVQLKAAASYAWIAFMVVLVAVAIIALAMMGSRGMEAARKLWAWVWLKKTEGQIKRLGQVKAANDKLLREDVAAAKKYEDERLELERKRVEHSSKVEGMDNEQIAAKLRERGF